MTAWNEFRRLLSSRLATTGMQQQSQLYRQAKDTAALQGVKQPSPRFLANLAVNLAAGREAPLGLDDDLSDVSEDIPMSTPFARAFNRVDDAQRMLREMQEDSNDLDAPFVPPFVPDEFDYNPVQLEFGDELDENLPASSNMKRTEVLRSLLRETGTTDITDDLGQDLPMSKLLAIAQAAPIWPLLTNEQKAMFLQNEGTLTSGKQYISKRMRTVQAPVRKTLVQLANGQRVQV
jgi:hypothetical protein